MKALEMTSTLGHGLLHPHNTRVHHDLDFGLYWPSTKGGTVHVTVSRSPHPYHRGVGFDELDGRGIYRARRPPLRPRSWTTWVTGPCMGGAGKRDVTPPIRTVRCRLR